MIRIASPALAIALAFSTLSVAQADPMYCGDVIISQGDSQEKLLKACGEPTSRNGNGSRWVYEREGSLPMIVTLANGIIQFIEAGQEEGLGEASPFGDRP